MTLILKASSAQLAFACIGSGLMIAFGIALFTHTPSPTCYVMLAISGFIAVMAPLQKIYDRLEITERVIIFRSIFKRWSVPLGNIKDWKIKGGNGRSLSLHFFTYDNREWCLPGLSDLGVRDRVKVEKEIAKCLRNYRRGK